MALSLQIYLKLSNPDNIYKLSNPISLSNLLNYPTLTMLYIIQH